MRTSQADGVLTRKLLLFAVLASMGLVLGAMGLVALQFVQIIFEPVEPVLPERSVVLRPIDDLLEGRGLDATRATLRVATLGDEAGALEHPQVVRHRG